MNNPVSTANNHRTMSRINTLRSLAKRPRHIALLGFSAVLIAAVPLLIATRGTAGEETGATPPAPAAPKVSVSDVEQTMVTEHEELTGRVDSAETVELRARVSGHLHEVHFKAGQFVRKGDLLFSIDPRWYQAQYDLARAQADQARAQADVAGHEARRAEELRAASAISNEEAESRRSRALVARAALASTEAALASARLDLENTQVRSPIDGRISRALVTPGNLISGSPGGATQLATIVSVGEAYVYADVDETTLLKFNRLLRENRIAVENGRVPVELQLADESGYPRRGYIESSDNRVNPATGSLLLRLVFPNTDKALVPGLFARVRIPISAPQPALLISERSIGTDQSQKYVLAVGPDNTAVYRTVKLGSAFHDKRVVHSGLQAGDRVIVNGLQRVRPGMKVEPENISIASPVKPTVPATQTAQLTRR